MQAAVRAIEYYLPEVVLTNQQLATEFGDWSAEKIEAKTGIAGRHIAAQEECSSDLGVVAARRLFATGACRPEHIDYLLLCTQSPDYFLPTTACLMQDRLNIPISAGALDFNLGCSGFVYGLGIAKGLIESGQACNVLLITADTYSKFIHPGDRSVRTLFGDGAAATLVQAVEFANGATPLIGPFVFGTDGKGAPNLIVPTGGMRRPHAADHALVTEDESGSVRTANNLYMNGAEIFNFTLRVVPAAVKDVLARAGLSVSDVDLFVFHQANQFMLDHLRKKLKIVEEKFYVAMRDCGNTVSSTIPIALRSAQAEGRLRDGQRVMLVGFGVGYSWAATMIRWGDLSA